MNLPTDRIFHFLSGSGPEGRTTTVPRWKNMCTARYCSYSSPIPESGRFFPTSAEGARRQCSRAAASTTEAMAKAMISQALSRWLDQARIR